MPACDEKKKYVFDDAKRPALPYVAGACFKIKQHEPLTPFDGGTSYENPEVSSLSDPVLPTEILRPNEILEPSDNLTPWVLFPSRDTNPCKIAPGTITERYLRHRPRKTMPHHKDRTTRRLDIVRQIRVRDGAYSQVVQCRVDGIQGPLVAKIFDPLYSSDDVELDEGQSPVGLTESEWSREAAAYNKIKEEGLDGRYTPRFEGCWSFDMPYELELVSNSAATHISTANTTTGGRQSGSDGEKRHRESSGELVRRTIKVTRNVRLLLMEYIPGDSILHLLKSGDYKKIPAKVRMDLVAQAAEAESALWHIRVSHGDRHSRNVVVCAKKEHHHSASSASSSSFSSSSTTTTSSSSSSHSGKGEEGARNGQKQQEQRDQGFQEWRAVWVDFGNSVVLDLPNAKSNIKGRLPPLGELPPNPMTRCRGSWPLEDLCLANNTNWIDKRYDKFEPRRKWMEARWGEGSPSAHRYQPVEYDKLFPRIEE
ncbi:hypothetical protein N8I77_002996 [Diaporthe amygdali]|uniref:Protein kinase domain-containing protein n=1 Tax=Phomopsis amygdali TaxID=1214568 RepID=A0AAD9SJ08_PHOAM|nr:hypothetical protein N8I77_002996 [Diaporthe amygdali]